MPKQGAYTEDVMLAEWSAAEGARVEAGDPLFVLETDKASNDVEADTAGFVHHMLEAGETVPIGQQVGVIADTREEYESLVAAGGEGSGAGTDAGAAEHGATERPSDDDVSGHPFLSYLGRGGAAAVAAATDGPPAGGSDAAGVRERSVRARDAVRHDGSVRITPRARALLAARGVPLDVAGSIAPTGAGGRVTDRDVLAYLEAASAPPAVELPPAKLLERIPLRGIRGTIARRMLDSLLTTAQLTSVLELDVSPVEALRQRLNAAGAEPRVGFAPIFVALVAEALREHPLLNARMAEDAIEVLADVDIAVAVETPDGIVAPVVRNADTLPLAQIAERVAALAARARSGSLAPEELDGGTFTLSNGGIHPVEITTPILNPPQVALLWLGRARLRPVATADGEIVARPTLNACLTYDHRAVDGGPAAAFLATLARLVAELVDRDPTSGGI